MQYLVNLELLELSWYALGQVGIETCWCLLKLADS